MSLASIVSDSFPIVQEPGFLSFCFGDKCWQVNARNLFVEMPQLIAEIARALLNPVSLCVSIFGPTCFSNF